MENIVRYKKFVFSSYQAAVSKLKCCLKCILNHQRRKSLLHFENGVIRI